VRLTSDLQLLEQRVGPGERAKLVRGLFDMAVDQAPRLVAQGVIRSAVDKLTLYSLFKQATQGSVEEAAAPADSLKLNAWRQQRGKSQLEAQLEYVLLVASCESSVKTSLELVLSGQLAQINYKPRANLDSPGGALAKSVPRPKNLNSEADRQFVQSLSSREVELKDLYEQIRKSKDGHRLVQLVAQRTIQPSERDGLGRCPLMFAIDSELGLETCKRLVSEAGCSTDTKDAQGDTLLHYAVNLESKDIEKWLLEEQGVDPSAKNSEGLDAYS
jgi:acyl-CoA-binding protein